MTAIVEFYRRLGSNLRDGMFVILTYSVSEKWWSRLFDFDNDVTLGKTILTQPETISTMFEVCCTNDKFRAASVRLLSAVGYDMNFVRRQEDITIVGLVETNRRLLSIAKSMKEYITDYFMRLDIIRMSTFDTTNPTKSDRVAITET